MRHGKILRDAAYNRQTINMKSVRALIFSAGFIFASFSVTDARTVRSWTDQELLDKSDLVVIAVPTATHDTKERGRLPGDNRQPVIGVQTEFSVTAVLKGPQKTRTVTVNHYRPDKIMAPNAPAFVSFDPRGVRAFRLYLVREANGSYVPVAGQQDPGLSIREQSTK